MSDKAKHWPVGQCPAYLVKLTTVAYIAHVLSSSTSTILTFRVGSGAKASEYKPKHIPVTVGLVTGGACRCFVKVRDTPNTQGIHHLEGVTSIWRNTSGPGISGSLSDSAAAANVNSGCGMAEETTNRRIASIATYIYISNCPVEIVMAFAAELPHSRLGNTGLVEINNPCGIISR